MDSDLQEARTLIERALYGHLPTLHIGPLDYNVFTICDYLRTAAALIERYGQERSHAAASPPMRNWQDTGHRYD